MTPSYDVAIVGGGIVGLATGWRLLQAEPDLKVVLLEAERGLARHQTGHNSGVIHAGLYYKPGSEKAVHCARGRGAMYAFAEEHGIPHDNCGKLVVATEEAQLPALEELERRARANGLEGITRLDGHGLRDHEPHVRGVAGLHVAETGIIDYPMVARKIAELGSELGLEIQRGQRVRSVISDRGDRILRTNDQEFRARTVVSCAGLHGDRFARMCGVDPGVRIVPFRGEYYRLVPDREHLCRHLIYPVPDARFPFLGVHFTRMIHGGVECGPNAVLALAREGYDRATFSGRDTLETLTFGGFHKLARRFLRTGVSELVRSLSANGFARSLQGLIPDVTVHDILPYGAGVRAQAVTDDGQLVDDFRVIEEPGLVLVLNAPSPAATASLSIGESIAERVVRQL